MERDKPAEIINPNGLELTQKIAEMMRHPKIDTSPEVLEEIAGSFTVDLYELQVYDRSLLTAYYDALTGTELYLTMPQPDSPSQNSFDARWQIHMRIPQPQEGEFDIVRALDITVDEMSYECSVSETTLVYREGIPVRPDRKPKVFDQDNIEETLMQFANDIARNKKIAELTTPAYEKYHPQIMDMLNSFSEDDEVLHYDPANGVGL